MKDGKIPRWLRKVLKRPNLGDMSEGETGPLEASGKGKPARSKENRKRMRMRKSVGQNKKAAKAPPVEPKPQPDSKPEKDDTVVTQPADRSSGSRVTAFKGIEDIPSEAKKPPVPRPRPPRKPPVPPSPPRSGKKSLTPEPDEEARALALYEAEEEWGHQMGDFERLPNDSSRNRIYKSKCIKCDRMAIVKVVFYDDSSEKQQDIRVLGEATEGPCSLEPRLFKVRSVPSSRVEEIPVPEFPKPAKKQSLDEKACELARNEAEKKGHQMGDFERLPYAGGRNRKYKSRCVHCGERAFGIVDFLTNYSERQAQVRESGLATEKTCPSSEKQVSE